MRRPTAIACAAALLPAIAFASLSAKPHHRSGPALIYLVGPGDGARASSSSRAVTSASPADVNTIVSSFLAIDEYEHLRQGLDVPEQVILAGSDQRLGLDSPSIPPLILVADRLGKDGSISDYLSDSTLSSKTLLHTLKVDKSPTVESWYKLAQLHVQRLGEKFGFYASHPAHQVDEGIADRDHIKRILLPGSLNGAIELDPAMQDEAFEPYLRSLVELAASQQEQTGLVRLTGIKQIAHKHGRESDEVAQAKEMMRLSTDAVIQSHAGKVVFVLAPNQHGHMRTGGDGGHRHLREPSASNLDIFSTVPHALRKRAAGPSIKPIVSTVGLCYSSQEVCSNSTSTCSGHGQCVQGRRVGPVLSSGLAECWVCQCEVTKDSKGRNRYYSGAACQKEDVSSQFFLLAGSTLLLILIAAASIIILASIGYEPLPSTLAALGGAAAGHHKRD